MSASSTVAEFPTQAGAKVKAAEIRQAGQPRLIAIDDGYAQVKVYDPESGIRVVIPSSVRGGVHRMTSLDGTNVAGVYETAGRRYTAGGQLAGEDTRFDGYHISDLNRIGIIHGLVSSGLGGEQISLTVGLPVKDFFLAGGRNERLIAAKKESLMVPVSAFHAPSDRQAPTIVDVRVAPQAVSAWIDYAMDDSLQAKPGVDLAAPVAVVDIGGRTTDVAVVLGGTSIDHARTGTENVGVLDVRALIENGIRAEFDLDEPLTAEDHALALRDGTFMFCGQKKDVRAFVEPAVAEIANRIERTIQRTIGKAHSVSAVLFVGGGANVFGGLVERFPHGRTPADPEFANVRGMWRFAKQMQLRKAAR